MFNPWGTTARVLSMSPCPWTSPCSEGRGSWKARTTSQGIVETWSQTGSLLRLNYVPPYVPWSCYGEILNLGADGYHVLSSGLPGACPACRVPRPASSTLLVLPSTLHTNAFVLVQNLSWGLDEPGPLTVTQGHQGSHLSVES